MAPTRYVVSLQLQEDRELLRFADSLYGYPDLEQS